MTLKNNRAPLLGCFDLCASFHSRQWNETQVTMQKRSIVVAMGDFLSQIWQMAFKNNRAHLLCYFKLCASFHSHWWIETGVTAQKHPISVKIDNFFGRVTLKFDGWLWKTLGSDLCDLDLWLLTLAFRMDITFVIGDNSWKFHDDTMMGTWRKRCDRWTDGLNHS